MCYFCIFHPRSDQAVPRFLWQIMGYTENNIFLVNRVCAPPSYEILVTSIQLFFEERWCFFRGMIKSKTPGFCNRLFKCCKTTIQYTIVSLFPYAILLYLLSSFQHIVPPLDTRKMFLIILPSISQFHNYHGWCFWRQCCCNLSCCPVFCTHVVTQERRSTVKPQRENMQFSANK